MTYKNTTNFIFLEKIKPKLFKLAIKMEEDLLITPVSMLTYSTRFLEFILHDIAEKNDYDVNTKVGFVDKVNQLIRFNYLDNNLDNNLPQLLIDAYKLRSDAIHNHHIDESLKDDRKIAFRLNETLFYIADAYYKKLTGNDEEHVYVEPKSISELKNEPSAFKKDNLDYGHVSYSKPKSDKIPKDKNIVKPDVMVSKKEDTTDIKSIDESSIVKETKDIPNQNSQFIHEKEIRELVKLLENGYSLQNALKHVDLNKTILNNWYIDKKSEFIGGYNDSLFIKYNELLIENTIKSIIENKGLGNNSQKVDFWMQYFEEFIDEHSKNLTGDQLKVFKIVFKKNIPKKDKITNDNEQSIIIPDKSNKSIDKIELKRRKELMLENIDRYNFQVALKKSKLNLTVFQKSKKEFLNGKRNNFYNKLSQKLMNKYLSFRKDGKSTNEFCKKMAIDKFEVDFWTNDGLFKDFQIRYNKIRINLFKKAMLKKKSQYLILNDLEMDENQFNDLIQLVINDTEYIDVRPIVRQYCSSYSIKVFINEFRKNPNIDAALKKSHLTKEDLKIQLRSNKKLYKEYSEIRVKQIEMKKIYNEEVNLDNLDMTQEEYSQLGDEMDEKVQEKQIKELTNGLSDGMLLITASNMGFDVDELFDLILKGSVDNNKYSKFADEYWKTHIEYINSLNSNKRNNGFKNSQNNIEIFGLKTHVDYWKKWGLITQNNIVLSVQDVKKNLKENIKE